MSKVEDWKKKKKDLGLGGRRVLGKNIFKDRF